MLKTLCGIYSQAVLRCPITVSLPTGKTWNTLNNVNYHLKMKIVMIIFSYRHHMGHSCFKWPLEEIYNLIFEHLTHSAILVPNWNT